MNNAYSRSVTSLWSLLCFCCTLWAGAAPFHTPLLWSNSPFTFAEAEMASTPGTTIEVCVNKNLESSAVNFARIKVAGSESPHLSDFTGAFLWFPSGITQVCFDLEIGSSPENGLYKLVIAGYDEYLRLDVGPAAAHGLCGSVPALGNVKEDDAIALDRFGNYYTPEMVTIPQIAASFSGGGTGCGCEEFEAEGITLELFEPFFEDRMFSTGSGFDEGIGPDGVDVGRERREVVCAVLQYLENVIIPNASECNPETQERVNIQVQPSLPFEDYSGTDDLGAFEPGVLGYASFYIPNFQGYFGIPGSVIHPAPWVVINSGETPFLSNPDSYHALARFNFGDFEFTTNYENSIVEGRDLFSVVLHEIMHSLGFASSFTIDSDNGFWGNSNPGEVGLYFPFDEFLSYNGQEVIERSTAVDNFPVGGLFFFNDQLAFNNLYGVCGGDDNTHLLFNGEIAGGHRIYTGDEFEAGTSFSHLDGDCVAGTNEFVDFVMHRNFPVNVGRRVLQDAELDILRTMGYNVDCAAAVDGNNLNYTAFDCDAVDCAVGSVHNGINIETCVPADPFVYELAICPPEEGTIGIPVDELLFNDPNATEIAFALTDGVSGGEVSLSGDGAELIYTTNTLGTKVISYAALGCDGQVSNTSLIYINVIISDDPECLFFCAELQTCAELGWGTDGEDCQEYHESCTSGEPENACNLICNPQICGNFRSPFGELTYPSGNTGFDINPAIYSRVNIPGWVLIDGRTRYGQNYSTGQSYFRFGYSAFNGYTGSVMTYVPVEPLRDYLFAFNTVQEDQDGIDTHRGLLLLDLIEGQGMVPATNQTGQSSYDGPRLSIFENGQIESNDRHGGCFQVPDQSAYSAIHVQGFPPDDSPTPNFAFYNFEVIKDDFSAGFDQTSLQCGQTMTLGGDDFCMLSDVAVLYSWFELDTDGNPITPALHTYTMVNGASATANFFTVAPGQTTTYRLIRAIDNLGGLPNDFAFCTTEDEVTITVLEQVPVADFTWQEIDCGDYNFFSDPSSLGNTHVWYLNEVDEAAIFSEEANPMGVIFADGTYTIIHQVSGPCGVTTVEEVITVEDCDNCLPPVAGFSYVQDCEAGTVTLTANNPEGEHSWDVDNDGTIDFTGVTTVVLNIVDPAIPFTTTIIHTVENECMDSDQTVRLINDLEACQPCSPPVAGFSYVQDCEAGTVTLMANNAEGEHSWDVDNDGTIDFTGVTTVVLNIVDPTVPFTTIITHTIENECMESDVSTVTIDDLEVCEQAFVCPCTGENAINVDAGEGTTVSSLIATGEMPVDEVSSQCLAVKGHLIVDQAAAGANGFYTIELSEVRMQPGSKITVNSGAALAITYNLVNGGIHGCEALWQGIHLAPQEGSDPGGRLRLYVARIEDAIHAVHLGNGSVFEMSFTTLDRNHIGIYMPPAAPLQYVYQPTFFYVSTITGASDLLPPYDGQTVNTGMVSRAGIELNNLKYFQIGGGNYGVRIADSNYGVIARNTGLDVLNSRIHNLITDPTAFYSNTGIYIEDESWTQVKNTRFHDMQYGIRGFNASLVASSNIIGEDTQGNRGNVRVGVSMQVGIGDIIRIVEQNKCYTQSYGIFTNNTHSANAILIDDNTLELMLPPAGIINFDAIRLGDALESGVHDDLQISRNIINLHNGGSGISLFGVNGVTIADNDVTFLSTLDPTAPGKLGINLFNASDNYVYDNTVIGDTPSDFQTGIYVFEGDRNKLCCNFATNTYYGALFRGTCEATLLRHTTFTGNNRGLQCNQNTRIGVQTAAGNMWDESLVWQATHLSQEEEDVELSRFFVAPPPGSNVWPDNISVQVLDDDWFFQGTTAPSCDDDTDNCSAPELDDLAADEEYTQKLLTGVFSYGDYPITSEWEAKRAYYRSQRATSEEVRENWPADKQAFYRRQELGNTDLFKLNSIAEQLEETYVVDIQLSNAEKNLSLLRAQLEALDSEYVEDTEPDAAYLEQRKLLIEQIQDAFLACQTAKANKRSEHDLVVGRLQVENDLIVAEIEAAAAMQAVNKWYLETIAQGVGDLTAEAELALLEIAESCPLRYGAAVGRAQALLINYGKSFTESSDCEPIQNLQIAPPMQENAFELGTSDADIEDDSNRVEVYPNPSSGNFSIEWPTIANQMEWEVKVFDIHGQQLLRQFATGRQLLLEANHLPAGIYWIKLQADDAVISRRIIIQ